MSFLTSPSTHSDDSTAASRLLVLACSGTKRPDPGHMPAFDRYNGPLWQMLRTIDPDGSKARSRFSPLTMVFRKPQRRSRHMMHASRQISHSA
jgi:hypothetical protein